MLEVCVNVFGGVEEAGLREEIAQSEEGRNKLKGTPVFVYVTVSINILVQVL